MELRDDPIKRLKIFQVQQHKKQISEHQKEETNPKQSMKK
jgi:hypothetical protein